MTINIVSLAGDGIGPEVVAAAEQVLVKVADRFRLDVKVTPQLMGGCAIDACGEPLPAQTVDACLQADAVLLGAIGGPKWDDPNASVRPEQGLLQLRKVLQVFANLRPLKIYPKLAESSPLKTEKLDGVDFVVVRELIGGIYFGEKIEGSEQASDLCQYSRKEVERIARVAFTEAQKRKGKVTSVDKANVLASSRLWRQVVTEIQQAEFPDVELHHQLVDSCTMKLIQSPAEFDVILTENMFGDILSDEASVLAGSMGLLASASVGEQYGLFEPIHGSAPDIAGQGIANPYATILSAAMMLRWLDQPQAADAIEQAVEKALADGILPADLEPGSAVTTADAAQAVLDNLDL